MLMPITRSVSKTSHMDIRKNVFVWEMDVFKESNWWKWRNLETVCNRGDKLIHIYMWSILHVC